MGGIIFIGGRKYFFMPLGRTDKRRGQKTFKFLPHLFDLLPLGKNRQEGRGGGQKTFFYPKQGHVFAFAPYVPHEIFFPSAAETMTLLRISPGAYFLMSHKVTFMFENLIIMILNII